MMRVYLDNCCFNRPYDDQSQFKVSMETRAKLHIQDLIRHGRLELVDSFMLAFENGANPDRMRRDAINSFREQYRNYYIPFERKEMLLPAIEAIMETGVKYKDAVHVACAEYAKCDYLLTTDTRLLKYRSGKVRIVNPLEFTQNEEEEE